MLVCISDEVLVRLKYPNKHSKLHQGLDYIDSIALNLIVLL